MPPMGDVLASSSDENAPLATALSVLFEPSPTLLTELVPQVKAYLASGEITTYCGLVDSSTHIISTWDDDKKAQFIAGHPRIGEVKFLSQLSAREQASVATPPQVLARLDHLNACYEHCYPGLRYITFVNGRSRATIMEEMEDKLALSRSMSSKEPPVSSLEVIAKEDERWKAELQRAVKDVGKIAETRVRGMGLM